MKEKLIVAGLNPYCWDSEAVCSKIGLFEFFEELKIVFDGQTIIDGQTITDTIGYLNCFELTVFYG